MGKSAIPATGNGRTKDPLSAHWGVCAHRKPTGSTAAEMPSRAGGTHLGRAELRDARRSPPAIELWHQPHLIDDP
ncbi:MAG: hypothetical protein AMXMBFR59_33770 [Rhodanobacteraceae bacterium]